MNNNPREKDKDLDKDLRTFEKLPGPTKDLLIVQNRVEKAIGPEKLALDKAARDKSK